MKTSTFILAACLSFTGLYAQTNIEINSNPAERQVISPYIYGINPYVYTEQGLTGIGMHDAGINPTSLRFGGDAVSSYNWENNYSTTSNSGWWQGACYPNGSSEFEAENDNNHWVTWVTGTQSNVPAAAILKMAADAAPLNAYTLVQLTGMNLVAADGNGCISTAQGNSQVASGRFKQTVIEKPGVFSLNPDLNDDFVYTDEKLNYLIQTLGNSTTAGGIKGYSLDNEPGLWQDTHPLTYKKAYPSPLLGDILDKNIAMAKRVKALDPNADIFGLSAYGFMEFVHGVQNQPAADYNTYMLNIPGYNDAEYKKMKWLAAYLHNMKLASEQEGVRLLDVLDIHFYNVGDTGNFMDIEDINIENELRQDSRSFWDPVYVENSWITNDIAGWGGNPPLPYNAGNTFQKLIDDFYPGTKLSISEWGWLDYQNKIAGAIYISDMLGAFGKTDVYMANYFGRVYGYLAGAFKIFTNYDNNNSRYADISVGAASSNNDLVSVYASIDNDTEDTMHIVLINRSNSAQNVNINLNTQAAQYESSLVYALLNGSNGVISQLADVQIANNEFTFSLQASGIYHLVMESDGLGVESIKSDIVSVFPNPTSDLLTITSNEPIEKIEIYDLTGKLLFVQEEQPSDNVIVNLEHLHSGIYMVQISSGGATHFHKVIKK